jgi:hypothetical protein
MRSRSSTNDGPARGALLLTFPLDRRRGLVKKLTRQMIDRPPAEAEKHLRFELSRHRRLLTRWQLSETAIDAQLWAFQGAVRQELRRVAMSPLHKGRGPSDGGRGGGA